MAVFIGGPRVGGRGGGTAADRCGAGGIAGPRELGAGGGCAIRLGGGGTARKHINNSHSMTN